MKSCRPRVAQLPWWIVGWADNLGRGLPFLTAACDCVARVGKGRISVSRRAPQPVSKLLAEVLAQASLTMRQAQVGSFPHSPW